MSTEALQRTVRRTGAVVVLAVGLLARSFLHYASYGGVPVGGYQTASLLVVAGAVLYLFGSVFVAVASRLEPSGDATADRAEE